VFVVKGSLACAAIGAVDPRQILLASPMVGIDRQTINLARLKFDADQLMILPNR